MPMNTVAAVIVAAGSSSRLGQPKQLLLIEGEPMLQRVISFAREARASPIVVVLGAHRELIEKRVDFLDTSIVVNEEWQEGLASSIRAGVIAIQRDAPQYSGLLLLTCDQPRVSTEHLRALIDTFIAQPKDTAVASKYVGTRGIPAIFPRSAAENLCALQGDKGARFLLAQSPWPVIEIPLQGGEIDIDRPEDLARLR
jgi:molybdenum cofactor cytidylyltransferase